MLAEGKEGTTMRNVIKNYFLEEDAIGVVEIILILVKNYLISYSL